MDIPTFIRKLFATKSIFLILALGLAYFFFSQAYVIAPDEGKLGGPIQGLRPNELRKFYATREVFKHEFTPEEGLGPIFNGRSCFECHGQPGTLGGEGRDVSSTGVIRIGQRIPGQPKTSKPLKEVITDLNRNDVDLMFFQGGPALERKSITSEFPNKYPANCQVELATVPQGTELISLRHAPPLFGFGLIEAIPDSEILNNIFKEVQINPRLAGRAISHVDPLTNGVRVGRFGWKNQNPTLAMFTAEALNVEMGITTYMQDFLKSSSGISKVPPCLVKYLPPEPNDRGTITSQLSYCQALLAPPGRGAITDQVRRGDAIFQKLECAVCHTAEMSSAPTVYVVDPDSPAPKLHYMEITALESKPVRAYSDFLLHKMGLGLADGLPQQGASGGEWRTTPLWGLRFKKFFLHDGRTQDLSEAILAHGGQAQEVTDKFKRLPENEKQDLLAFLKSL